MKDIIEEEIKELFVDRINFDYSPVSKGELRSFANKIIKSFAKEVEEKIESITIKNILGVKGDSLNEKEISMVSYNSALSDVRSTLKELEKEYE